MTVVIILIVVVCGLALLAVGSMHQVYRPARVPHSRTPAEFGIEFEEVRLPTANGRQLYGWWIPAAKTAPERNPTLILVHGWKRNLERMLDYIRELHPRGYNLLAFDSRNHGSSDNDRYSSMLKFAEDIRAAVTWVAQRPGTDPARIGCLGLSIGGSAAIYVAAHEPRLRSLVTIGAFANPTDVMRLEFQKRHIPYYPLVWLLFRYFEFRLGLRFRDIAPVNHIAAAWAEVFLVHGTEDKTVPVSHARALKKAGNESRARLWELPGYGHSNCHQEPEFWNRVAAFYAETL